MIFFLFQALDSLQKISDGSLDDIEFPDNLREIKEEPGDDFKVEVEEANYVEDLPDLQGDA